MSSKRKTSPAPAEAVAVPAQAPEEPKKKHKKVKSPEEAVEAPSPVVEDADGPSKKKKKQAVAAEAAPVAPPSPNPKKSAADSKKKNGAAAATAAAASAAAAPLPVAPAAALPKAKTIPPPPAGPQIAQTTVITPTPKQVAAPQSQVVLITQPKPNPKLPAAPAAAPSAPMQIAPLIFTDPKKSKPAGMPSPSATSPNALSAAGLQAVPPNPALMAALGIPSGAALNIPGGLFPQFFLASGSDLLNSQIKKRKRPEVNPQEMFTDTLNAFTAAMTQLAALLPRSYSNTSAMNDMAKVYDNAINTLHAQRQKLSTKPPKVKIDDKGNVEEDDSRGHRWTDEDTIKMMEMKTNGQTNRAVALALGRSTAAVSQRYKLVKAGKVACPGFDPVAAKAKAAATAAVAAITGPPLKPTGAAAEDGGDDEDDTDEEDEDDDEEEEHTSHLGNIVASRFGPLGGAKGVKADDDE